MSKICDIRYPTRQGVLDVGKRFGITGVTVGHDIKGYYFLTGKLPESELTVNDEIPNSVGVAAPPKIEIKDIPEDATPRKTGSIKEILGHLDANPTWTRTQAVEELEKLGFNKSTIGVQYGKWRKAREV